MKDDDKIKLADMVIAFIQDRASSDETPILVGTLTRAQGIRGFKTCEIGHPVFEFKDRYILYMESNDGKTTVAVPYYKKTFNVIELLTHNH